MNPFATEVEEVIEEGGINVRGRLLPLYVRCFIAGAPARAFILNHYSNNAHHACSKCKVEGHYSVVPNFERTKVFTDVENRHRTDKEYLAVSDEVHHKGQSSLNRIMGSVSKVPFEVMHLVYIDAFKNYLKLKLKVPSDFGA